MAIVGLMTEHGPIIHVIVMQSSPYVDALKAAGQKPSKPIRVRALIDTGAACTAVDQALVSRLGLMSIGTAKIHTPSTAGAYVERPQFDGLIAIEQVERGPLHMPLPLLATELTAGGFEVLIGRDILARCVFHYDGPHRSFSLDWATPEIGSQ